MALFKSARVEYIPREYPGQGTRNFAFERMGGPTYSNIFGGWGTSVERTFERNPIPFYTPELVGILPLFGVPAGNVYNMPLTEDQK